MRRSIFLGGALLITLATGGCGSGAVREPNVSLEGVQLAGFGLRGGTLLVNVQIQNPNPFALNADEVRYEIAIADATAPADTVWTELANGVYDQKISVGGGQTVYVQVPVEFTYAGLGGAASSILREGSFTYRASGSVDVNTPLGGREVPFEKNGVVSVSDAN
jgi:LEA14-like dessication related protein